jgi:hypothetical protein
MIWHYDLSNAEPIIRDLPVCGTTDILEGAVVGRVGAVTTAENRYAFQNAVYTTLADVVGVSAEFYDYSAHISNYINSNAATAASTGVTNYIKVIINPLAVWLAEYSQHTSDDTTTNGTADTTGKTWTGTMTAPGDDAEGNWLYVTFNGGTTGGAGNLFQIGLSSTTVYTAATHFDNHLKGNLTTDTCIILHNPYMAQVVGGSINVSNTAGRIGTMIHGSPLAGTDTGAAITLQLYVTDKGTALQPLRVEQHSGKNYDYATCRLFGDLFFMDHLCLGGGVATAPLLT